MNVKIKIPQPTWDFTLLSATQKFYFVLFCFASLAGAIPETSHPLHMDNQNNS
jgi:hypothetical protein